MSCIGSMDGETLITDQPSEKVQKDKEGIRKGNEEDIACTVAKVEQEEEKSGTSEHVATKCSEITAAETNGKVSDNSKEETSIEKEKQDKEECLVVEGPIVTDTVESTETTYMTEKDHEKRIEDVKNSDIEVLVEAKGIEECIEKDASDGKVHDVDKCEELQVGNGKKEEETEENKDFSGSEVLYSTTKVEEQQKEECKVEAPMGSDAAESITDHEKRIEEEEEEEDVKISDSDVLIEAKGVEEGIEKDALDNKVHDHEKCEELQSGNGKREETSKDSGSEVLNSTTKFEEEIVIPPSNTDEKENCDPEISETVETGSDKEEEGKKEEMTSIEEVKSREHSDDSCSQPVLVTKPEEEEKDEDLKDSNGTKEETTVISTKEEHETEALEKIKKHHVDVLEKCKEVDIPQEKSGKEYVSQVEEISQPFANDATEKIKTLEEGSGLTAETGTNVLETQATVTTTIYSSEEIEIKCDEVDPKEVEQDSDKTDSICREECKKEDTGKRTFAEELLKEKIAEGKISPTASVTELVNELVDGEDQTEVLAKEVVPDCPRLTETKTVEEEKRVKASNPEHVKEHEEEEEEELKLKEKEMTEKHEHVTAKTDEGDHAEQHSSSKHGHHGIMSKVKHSISKVKNKMLGKSSTSKAMSLDNKVDN